MTTILIRFRMRDGSYGVFPLGLAFSASNKRSLLDAMSKKVFVADDRPEDFLPEDELINHFVKSGQAEAVCRRMVLGKTPSQSHAA